MLGPILFSLLFVASCSLFKKEADLSDLSTETLREQISLTGEGKGRLTYRGSQNLFGFESGLNESTDWFLAVAIPLHGEEALIFPDLKNKSATSHQVEAFEKRLNQAVGDSVDAAEFLELLRKTVRFLMAKNLNLAPECQSDSCVLDGDEFQMQVSSKDFVVRHRNPTDLELEVHSQNLTESIFKKSVFVLIDRSQKRELLTLELFWN